MRKFLVAVMALAAVTAACSSSGEEVGRAGDRVFTSDDIFALYEDDWFDTDSITIDEERRTDIFRLLAIEALTQAAETDFGIVPDPATVQQLIDERMAEITSANASVADFLGVPGASVEMLRLNSNFGVVRREVINELVTDGTFLEELYDDGRGVTTVCARHILTESADDIEDVAARLAAGEDFAALATEVSTDTGTPGGDLGCGLASRYVAPFARATVEGDLGVPLYPVETEFGFHLIIVDERTAPTFEDVVADPSAFVPESEADFLWNDWFNEALRVADVEVDPRFGEWTPVGITPPSE